MLQLEHLMLQEELHTLSQLVVAVTLVVLVVDPVLLLLVVEDQLEVLGMVVMVVDIVEYFPVLQHKLMLY